MRKHPNVVLRSPLALLSGAGHLPDFDEAMTKQSFAFGDASANGGVLCKVQHLTGVPKIVSLPSLHPIGKSKTGQSRYILWRLGVIEL